MDQLKNEMEELSAQVTAFMRATRGRGRRRRWPEEIQQRVLAMIAAGVSPHALTRRLRIPVQTFYAWRRNLRPGKKRETFLELPVKGHSSAVGLTLVTRRGNRIRGLSLEALQTLLRESVL